MQKVIANKWLVSAGVTVAWCLLVLPFTESVAFELGAVDDVTAVPAWVLKGVFAVALFALVALVVDLLARLRAGDDRTRAGLVMGGAYLVVLVVVAALVYPGHWTFDEFHVLHAAQTFAPYYWQHYLTVVFHTLCLYLVPTGVGIVLVQMLLAAAVVGYLASGIRTVLDNRRLAWLVVVPFLFLPVLFEVYHPLRMTAYSLVALLALGKVLLLALAPDLRGDRYREFVGYSVLVTLMAFWRTEGIFYLVLLPVVAARLGLLRELWRRNGRAVVATLAGLAVVACGFVLTQATSRPEYQLTALYNPLSVMVADGDLTGGDVDADLALIDTVMDVDHLRQYSDYSDIPGYWAPGALRPDYADHLDDFYRGVVSLVLHNPEDFLEARWKTFVATNNVDPARPYVPTGLLFTDAPGNEMLTTFERENIGAQPWDDEVRHTTMRALLVMQSDGTGTALRPWVWTVIPTLVGLVAMTVVGLARRRWTWGLLSLALLVHAGIVFGSAPAYYFMYYLPVYVVGNFLLAVALVRWLDRRLSARRAPVAADSAAA
ncbi:hypothetical protein [Geodermatophilus sp. CPCC 205761]|uniref:hypothetical protein n=1 Tax=Geodermatophilus sp. CPCC 205761 TaxID=2936597 RepID=UPI003EE8EBC6